MGAQGHCDEERAWLHSCFMADSPLKIHACQGVQTFSSGQNFVKGWQMICKPLKRHGWHWQEHMKGSGQVARALEPGRLVMLSDPSSGFPTLALLCAVLSPPGTKGFGTSAGQLLFC